MYSNDDTRRELEEGISELRELKRQTDKPLDVGSLQAKLDSLFATTVNYLIHKWPSAYSHLAGAPQFFQITVNMARHTYNTIRYLMADKRLEEHDWQWYTVFALSPLTRTVLDSVFNVVFMCEDFDINWYWYCQAGYRDVVEDLTRCRDSGRTLPGWDRWVELRTKSLDILIREFNIPIEIARNPRRVKHWPNPGAMVNYEVSSKGQLPPSRQFLQHLNDWFYRDLSSQAHLGFAGMSNVGRLVMYNLLDKKDRQRLEQEDFRAFRSNQVSRTLVLSIVLLSEINNFFKFGLDHRLLELWISLNDHAPTAREIFELRYKSLLPFTPINP